MPLKTKTKAKDIVCATLTKEEFHYFRELIKNFRKTRKRTERRFTSKKGGMNFKTRRNGGEGWKIQLAKLAMLHPN